MKRLTMLLVMGLVVISLVGTTVFAAEVIKTPAEVYSDLSGVSVNEAYEQRGSDKTFGQLAEEIDKYDEFREEMLNNKKAIIAERVKKGQITQEQADELLSAIEEHLCTTPGEQRLGREYGIGFGRGMNGQGSGYEGQMRRGLRLQDGSGVGRNADYVRGFGRSMKHL